MKEVKLNSKIERSFEELRNVPPRDPGSAARGRLQFLRQAEKLRLGVSALEEQRHKGWNQIFPPMFFGKEQPLMKAMIATTLALFVFFSAAGATVYAAQNDLPGQALYQVKTWSEDTAFNLARSEQTQMDYALDFADRRIAEAAGLVNTGQMVPEQLETRLRTQMDLALNLAAGLDEPLMVQQLEQIRLRSQNQLQIMNMLMTNAPESVEPILERMRDRIRQQIQLVELGQSDPQAFKSQVQDRERLQIQDGTGVPGPNGTQNQNGAGQPGPNGTQNQDSSGQPGPNGTQNQDGSGQPGPNGTQNQDGSGQPQQNGMQDQNQYGPGEPQTTGTPGNYGPAGTQPTEPSGAYGPGEPQATDTQGQYGPGEPQSTVTPVSNGPGPSSTDSGKSSNKP